MAYIMIEEKEVESTVFIISETGLLIDSCPVSDKLRMMTIKPKLAMNGLSEHCDF